jgi:hypothetical protein
MAYELCVCVYEREKRELGEMRLICICKRKFAFCWESLPEPEVFAFFRSHLITNDDGANEINKTVALSSVASSELILSLSNLPSEIKCLQWSPNPKHFGGFFLCRHRDSHASKAGNSFLAFSIHRQTIRMQSAFHAP